jgi:hypothetical protein
MKAFYAYPSSVPEVTQAIHGSKRILGTARRDLELRLWEENDISGRPLTDPIFAYIAEADMLVADITVMNFNVTFEVGYAIGLGKRIHLTRNGNIPRDTTLMDRIGIFDTLGFDTCTEEQTLSALLKGYHPEKGIRLNPLVNSKSPVYLLQTPQSSAAMLTISSPDQESPLGLPGLHPG